MAAAVNTLFALEDAHRSGVYGKRELALVRGAGARVWDEQGRAYIDCTAGIGVANVGHCHPRVVAAIQRQAETLITCPELVYNDRRAHLLQALTRVLPGDLERFYLCNSGAEAVEAALKFARRSTGRSRIVATMRGFHGRTFGALSATHKEQYRAPFRPLVDGFSHVPFGKLAPMQATVTTDTAAVLVEIVQGEGGVRPGEAAYFQALRRLCDERGCLLIVDEVQTGFGRTGRWFACQHMDLVPDMITLGKAMAGGVAMGAVALGPRVRGLQPGDHGSTFGGNPLACAAALATLAVLETEGLVTAAAEKGAFLQDRLRALDAPLIREVRGLGLMVGVELRQRAMPVVQALAARGVLALTAGTTVLRLLPPLVIGYEDLETVVQALDEALVEAAAL